MGTYKLQHNTSKIHIPLPSIQDYLSTTNGNLILNLTAGLFCFEIGSQNEDKWVYSTKFLDKFLSKIVIVQQNVYEMKTLIDRGIGQLPVADRISDTNEMPES
ncbi:hypothetical protein H5410_023865 [Solanum commersonii]|uniref:Uncharacterized protein n=1 Tax=Solanum commersonii TaxID=4109 RepID=A0A9J5ZKD5_SOLCO|nr:hypothetical protein H5410_023865 [Solanum commersonii]